MGQIKLVSKFLVITILILGLSSCDDRLEEPLAQQELVESIDYTNTDDMFAVLVGAYGNLNFLQWETFPIIGVRGDDVNAAGDQFPLQETDEFRYDPVFWMYNSTWLNLYGDLFDWNAAIEEIQKYKEFAPDPAVADQYMAEIKVMKGFELLQMMRLWGQILIPETSQPQELYRLEPASFNEGMQYISDLMDEAIPNLPAVHPNQRQDVPGGMTRYTALAVKALANLEAKNWSAVTAATSEIISSGIYSLEPDYYNLFKKEGELNDENMLEFQYSDFGEGTGESTYYLHAFFGPQGWGPAVPGASGGWGFWEPSEKYVKFMLDRDEELRLITSVLFSPDGIAAIESDPAYSNLPEYVSNVTLDGDTIKNYSRANFASGKFYLPSNELVPGRTRYGSGKNVIGIRYAEILLMHAEAVVMGGEPGALSADAAVNEVRTRARLPEISGVTLDDVLDEKFAEFSTEWGIRFYDLVRHDRTGELNYAGRTYDPATDRFIPYPLAQLDLLTQLSND